MILIVMRCESGRCYGERTGESVMGFSLEYVCSGCRGGEGMNLEVFAGNRSSK